MKAYFERESPHGLVGENLILEHLHPNIEGYFLMADAFFDTMRKNGFIAPQWDSTRIRPPEFYRKQWGVTELDKAYADIRIRILKGGWPFQPKKAPNRALVDFHPANLVDSLAYKTVVDDRLNLERAHVRLAELYARRHQFLKAFREYQALIDMTPVNVSPYLSAADMLVKARKLPEAIPYLKKSLQLKETAYANKWLGQIYLDQGRKQLALPFLEKAAQMKPNDPQLIYNLSGAYALTRQYGLARKTLGRLEKLAPNFPGAADLKKQLARIKSE
ncbi:MAG: hypothetical protein D6743_14985 [Calditrichaeota bacterium]|nr:MAG: hypothetical protein D6743_14985 [Calditrichota bacterium]